MAPRIKIDRESIVKAAVEIVRNVGESGLNARNIAKSLDCSTQPIFSNFPTMTDLKKEVINFAEETYKGYIEEFRKSGKYPEYKSYGMAYILFAKEEKELFKLLYMRDRQSEDITDDTPFLNGVYEILQQNTGYDIEKAKLFHLEMWTFVHGLAVMLATGYLEVDEKLCSKMLTDIFMSLKKE